MASGKKYVSLTKIQHLKHTKSIADVCAPTQNLHRLFLMDEAWRHAALEEAVSKVQMQRIDECMREVVLQMQKQIDERQEEQEHECQQSNDCGFDGMNFVQKANADTGNKDFLNTHDKKQGEHVRMFASDALFQVLNTVLTKKYSTDSVLIGE
jgi:hypothetical protein